MSEIPHHTDNLFKQFDLKVFQHQAFRVVAYCCLLSNLEEIVKKESLQNLIDFVINQQTSLQILVLTQKIA